MIALAKLIKYVKFINLNLPPMKSKRSFESSDSYSFSLPTSFTIKMPSSLKAHLHKYPLPAVFENKGIQSSYLANQWESLSAFFIFFLIGAFFGVLEIVLNKFTRFRILRLIVSKFRMITKWNLLSFLFFNTYDDITFYAIIEFRTLHLNSFWSFISFFTCIIVTCVAIYLLANVFIVSKARMATLKKIASAPLKEEEDIKFYKKWESHQVLYSGFEEESLLKKSCLLVLTCQPIVFYLVIGTLFEYPLVQTILLTLITLAVIIYLMREKPMKDRFNHFVAMTFELLCLIVNVCLLILAILQHKNITGGSTTSGACEAIIFSNMLVSLLSNIFMWTFILLAIKAAYKASSSKNASNKTAWFNLLVVPYQNPGMDFDDMSNEAFGVPVSPEEQLAFKSQKIQDMKGRNSKKIHPIVVKTLLPVGVPINDSEILDGYSKIPNQKIGNSSNEDHSSTPNSSTRDSQNCQLMNKLNFQRKLVKNNSSEETIHNVKMSEDAVISEPKDQEIPCLKDSNFNFEAQQRPSFVRRSKLASQKRASLSSNSSSSTSKLPVSIIIEETNDFKAREGDTSERRNSAKNSNLSSNTPRGSLAAMYQLPLGFAQQKLKDTAKFLRTDLLKKVGLGISSQTTKGIEPQQKRLSDVFSQATDDDGHTHSYHTGNTAESPKLTRTAGSIQPNMKDSPLARNAPIHKHSPIKSSKSRFTRTSILVADQRSPKGSEPSAEFDHLSSMKSSHLFSDDEGGNSVQSRHLLANSIKNNNRAIALSQTEKDITPKINRGSMMKNFFG